MKKKGFNGTYSSVSDLGSIRLINEDVAKTIINAKSNVLMFVSDGMGAENEEFSASAFISERIIKSFKSINGFSFAFTGRLWLKREVSRINKELYLRENDASFSKVGATLVVTFLINNKLVLLNIGDSRCYFYKKNELKLMTNDDSLSNYLKINKKVIDKNFDINKHVVTNALGMYKRVSYDLKTYKYDNETILLCSDGLYNSIKESDIKAILRTNDTTQIKTHSLINLANFNGGSDNISVSLWEPIND